MRRLAPLAVLIAICLWAAVVTAASLETFAAGLSSRDFTAFYRSAEGWWQTGDLYDPTIGNVNINPPHVSVLLFVPMLLWSLPVAATVWFAIQAMAGGLALAMIRRELQLPASRVWWIVPFFLASCAMQHHWREGQVTGFLLLISTIAWRAARHDQPSTAIWTAATISLKPWLVSWLPVLTGRRWLWTSGIGLGGVLVGIAVLGRESWTDWAAMVQSKPVRPMVVNLSLLAAIARALDRILINNQGGWPYGQPLWPILCVIVIALTWRARSGSVDRAWLTFGLAGILISPLGWAYYLVAVTGPLVAWGEAHHWPRPALFAIGLLMATRELMQWMSVGPTAWFGSSLAFFGVLFLWATALWWPEPTPRPQDSFSPVRIR